MKPFGDAVALGFAHERGRSFDAQAFDLVLEIARHVVGAVIVAQFQAARHTGRNGSEATMHALPARNWRANSSWLPGTNTIRAPRRTLRSSFWMTSLCACGTERAQEAGVRLENCNSRP
jgi:hypothetical protein